MELAKDSLRTLVDCTTINSLNPETLERILQFIVSCKKKDKLKPIDSSVASINEAYVSINSLFVEAAKHKFDEEIINSRLRDAGVSNGHLEKLCQAYKTIKDSTYNRLQIIGQTLDHIVDVNWRLDYNIKTSTDNATGILFYHISLVTTNQNKTNSVTFTCTVQQLQEIIHKLKDAVRHLEKISAGC